MVGLNGLLLATLVPRLTGLQVDASVYPVDAVQYMASQRLSGRLVVTYNWAQFVIAALGTDRDASTGIRVGFDGRFDTCYPADIIDHHFDFVLGTGADFPRHRRSTSAADPTEVLQRGKPNLVLISRLQIPSVQVMQQHGDKWTLLYQDGLAQLWGLSEEFDTPTNAQYIPHEKRVLNNTTPTEIVRWPALPNVAHDRGTVVTRQTSKRKQG